MGWIEKKIIGKNEVIIIDFPKMTCCVKCR